MDRGLLMGKAVFGGLRVVLRQEDKYDLLISEQMRTCDRFLLFSSKMRSTEAATRCMLLINASSGKMSPRRGCRRR